MTDDIPSLAAVTRPPVILTGKKAHISDIIGKPLVFTAWNIGISRYKTKSGTPKDCLTLHFTDEGIQYIVKTSSAVLLSQVREFMRVCPDAGAFKATAVKEGDYIVFR